ncbi:hypothetical protein HZ996_00095 [Cryomorphaceae bacterium]|nr:hypothetical protein HZ996_00095 [Cryomorphaceae bacterium]
MNLDSSNLIVYLYRWRMPLIVVTFLSAVAAAIFSAPAFIPPKFKSTVVLFPATTNSVSSALLGERNAYTADILEFGKEEEAEQMLQILYSDEIRDKVIRKFDLMNHYDIDPDSKYKQTNLYREFSSNITYRRTEYMSVEIDVLDTDPQLAADIANEIATLLDSVKNRVQKERAQQGLLIVEKEYKNLRREVKAMEDSLRDLRVKGIHDYEGQSAVLSEQIATAQIEGQKSVAQELQYKLDTLAKYGGAYTSLRDQLKFRYEELNLMKTRYEEAKVDAEVSLPHKFIVNEAFPAEKKTYPVRWLVVAISTLGGFVLTLLTIIVLDTVRKANKDGVAKA